MISQILSILSIGNQNRLAEDSRQAAEAREQKILEFNREKEDDNLRIFAITWLITALLLASSSSVLGRTTVLLIQTFTATSGLAILLKMEQSEKLDKIVKQKDLYR